MEKIKAILEAAGLKGAALTAAVDTVEEYAEERYREGFDEGWTGATYE